MPLTETELKQIHVESETLYPYPVDKSDIQNLRLQEMKRRVFFAAVTKERERAKGNANLILDMFKIFMPNEVDVTDRKQMAMYEAYHRVNKILEPEKYNQ